MCDAVRGTSWAYFRSTQAEASEPALGAVSEPGETEGKVPNQKGDQLQVETEKPGTTARYVAISAVDSICKSAY